MDLRQDDIGKMFDGISERYDFLNRVLSFAQDQRWRRALVGQIPTPDRGKTSRYLDVATGTGDVILQVAQKKTFTQLIGVDISKGMLAQAEKKANQQKNTNIGFYPMGACALGFKDNYFDCLSISFGLRNVTQKEKALGEFYRVLKPGGRLIILEFFNPPKGFITNLGRFYFRFILPLIGGLFSDKKAYRYLPKSVEDFYTPKELGQELSTLGYKNLQYQSFLFGHCQLIWADK
jgi:demethylmenaquinone methyltransferase/2-methoxy-6-polyprenyl-1,4-benzoquinol methylase